MAMATTPGSSGFASVESVTPLRATPAPFEGQPHSAARTVHMEYAYEQAEGQSVGRWVTRLIEFLRATTARSAGFQGRALEGWGLTATQVNGPSLQHQDTLTQPYPQQIPQQASATMSSTRTQPQQAPAAMSSARMQQALTFSPPEEFPPPPPPPVSRRPSTPAQRRLLSPEQVQRMRAH